MSSIVLTDQETNKSNISKNKKIKLLLSLINAYGINLALCSDLNIDFGNNQKLVDNPIFQFILFYASGYIITEDYKYSLVLPIVYFMLK